MRDEDERKGKGKDEDEGEDESERRAAMERPEKRRARSQGCAADCRRTHGIGSRVLFVAELKRGGERGGPRSRDTEWLDEASGRVSCELSGIGDSVDNTNRKSAQ